MNFGATLFNTVHLLCTVPANGLLDSIIQEGRERGGRIDGGSVVLRTMFFTAILYLFSNLKLEHCAAIRAVGNLRFWTEHRMALITVWLYDSYCAPSPPPRDTLCCNGRQLFTQRWANFLPWSGASGVGVLPWPLETQFQARHLCLGPCCQSCTRWFQPQWEWAGAFVRVSSGGRQEGHLCQHPNSAAVPSISWKCGALLFFHLLTCIIFWTMLTYILLTWTIDKYIEYILTYICWSLSHANEILL